jgi:hypothetical protein
MKQLVDSLADKETSLSEFASLLSGKKAMLRAVNGTCQSLKMAYVERERLVYERLREFRSLQNHMSSRYAMQQRCARNYT